MSDTEPMSALLRGHGPRARALSCCRNMSLAFGPPTWPKRPDRLWPCSIEQLDRLTRLWARGEKADAYEQDLVAFLAPWELERIGTEQECAARLRGAFWAVTVLRAAVAEDPSDSEAEQMLDALLRFLQSAWEVASVPESLIDRTHVANRMAGHLRRVMR